MLDQCKHRKVYMFVNVDWFFFSHRKEIAEAARAHQIDMVVFAGKSDREFDRTANGFDFKISPISRKFRWLWGGVEFCRVFWLVCWQRPDLVHAVTAKPILFLGLVCRILGVPFLASISGLGPTFAGSRFRDEFRKSVVGLIYKVIFSGKRTGLICQTEHDANFLVEFGTVRPEKIFMIYGSGVDVDSFRPAIREVRSDRVLCAARLLGSKGIFVYLDAVKILRDRCGAEFGSVQFCLAGPEDLGSPDGVPIANVLAHCHSSGVDYLGNVSDMAVLLKDVVLFVYPSFYPEGLPKILLEASASGVGIITSNHPGCADAVGYGDSGLLVEPNNPLVLADAIEALLRDDKRRAGLASNARAFALKNFDVKEVVRQHYELYERLF